MNQRVIDRLSNSSDRQFASEPAQSLLEFNGLSESRAIFRQGAMVRQRHRRRTVWETTLSRGDAEPMRVFVKMEWGRPRFRPRMSDLKTGQVFQSLPVREWHGLHRLGKLGVCVPQPLALFREGFWSIRDAVVIPAVPPASSVHEMIRSGSWSRLSPERQSSLLKAILAVLRRIHAAGLGWRGVSVQHMYPQLRSDETWEVWLIDCEGIHGAATRRTFARDFNRLWNSISHAGLDSATLERLRLETKTSTRFKEFTPRHSPVEAEPFRLPSSQGA